MNLAPLATPPSGRMGLEHGFAALTVLDPTCDRIALLVDNAHLLPDDALHYIEVALGAGTHLSVALAGHAELESKLALDEFSGLHKRLGLHLAPLTLRPPPAVARSRTDRNQSTLPTGTSVLSSSATAPEERVRSTDKQYTGLGPHPSHRLSSGFSFTRSMVWFWGILIGVVCTGAIALQFLGPPTRSDHASEVAQVPTVATGTQPGVSSTPGPPAPDTLPAATSGHSTAAVDSGVTAEALVPGGAAPPRVTMEPEMVPLPEAVFQMGSNDDRSERPVHTVTVKLFLIARYATTVREWQRCVQANACKLVPKGKSDEPITNVSWEDARQYIDWLSSTTGQHYRLPTEAEWEYAARAGTTTRYSWGNALLPGKASCKGCGTPVSLQNPPWVYAYPPNPFGLYGMGGGAAEWVADCWHRDYQEAPRNGSIAWDAPDCRTRVLRGGSWMDEASYLRVSSRESYDPTVRYPTHGFRVALSE